MLEPIAIFIQVLVCMTLATESCEDSDSAAAQAKTTMEVDITTALDKTDYRLLSMGGRVPFLPGMEDSQYATLKQQCGVRYLGASDLINTPEDKAHYNDLFQYATSYNQKMLPHCLEQTSSQDNLSATPEHLTSTTDTLNSDTDKLDSDTEQKRD